MKIITIITVDVHARDVVDSFSKMKPAIDSNNFNWNKQLRFKYLPEAKNADIRIAGYATNYSYEYIGNTGRLVITPLTDRCYITLTQALGLFLGGAPAGPAGTGKTETVKDLGRNLGLGVIVNNCSEQMDIVTTARIFSGLAQTGFWGCFDEFNRISIEVLSVVSTQVKSVLDAVKYTTGEAPTFTFEGTEINLRKTCGFFITMNPGYAGRTELPDNLKALFRSCAMVVPDLKEICQNMLMSEGFLEAKTIAEKFITLYTLSRDLLSKQKHYDWGLRAIKSLLRQAGGLKRNEANKTKSEAFIIMHALFDFNKAKIVPDDLIIFERLLQDLFKLPEKEGEKTDDINQYINQKIDEATESKEVNLQKDPSFTLKTRQLKETLEVRHCLFILGAPGCGKTSVWKTLFYTNKNGLGQESGLEKLSPKAITGHELFGYIDKTRVWRYGILSSIMKKMSKNDKPYEETMTNKWIILDGDIDPNWIESLNTVMDDNKVLTLTNGDRFPLDEFMRLIFEISNLRNATLATVSRGGVLYINEKDIGITPFFDKWVKSNYTPKNNAEDIHVVTRRVLQEFFKTTFSKVAEWKESDGFVAPIVEISLLQNFCTIFQHLIKKIEKEFKDMDDETKALISEGIFFFAFMWGVGGGLKKRKDMHNHIKACMKSKNKLKFPDTGICYDYYFSVKKLATNQPWVNWKEEITPPVFGELDLFSDIIIPNVEVTRLCYLTQINMLQDRAVLYIGDPGTGKTAIVNYFLKNYMETLQKEFNSYTFISYKISFNSFTDSKILQTIIDSQIQPRFSHEFGPLPSTKLIFFLDDLNMPQLDQFGTQSHVELLRQIIDYREYFDRKDLEFKKELQDLLFVGCQNPKAGSFIIDSRLQRHFCLVGATPPSEAIVSEIYTYILKNHFKEFRFPNPNDTIDKVCKTIIDATWTLYNSIKSEPVFNPSATKFHYQWNLREIAHIIDGMLRTAPQNHRTAGDVYLLWFHECNRVFRDRLLFTEDMKKFDMTISNLFIANFKVEGYDEGPKEPFIFVPFGSDITDEAPNVLIMHKSYDDLKKEISEYLERYQEEKGDLPLVLFDDAIKDICRISRIISNSCSHALLVGVGGSGKQSLSALASFIKEYEISQPHLTGTDYGNPEFLADLKWVMQKSVLKQAVTNYCFLINDNHIIDEYFLVFINDFLNSYWVDEMFETKEELKLALEKSVKSAAVNLGFVKSAADCPVEGLFACLLYRIKTSFHFIVCMSPVGDSLRIRCRKFPSLLNDTSIDWFHEWPDTALKAVSARNIGLMPQFEEDEAMITKLSSVSSELHKSIRGFNDLFFKSERRHNYTTPKSFLELIYYFQSLVTRKVKENEDQTTRLQIGLTIVANTSKSIEALKKEIESTTVRVNQQKEISTKMTQDLEEETKKISKDKEKAELASKEADEASANAAEQERIASEELAKALPAKESALKSAQDIQPDELDKFKNPNNPSAKNFKVFKLMYLLFNPTKKMPSDDIKKEMQTIKAGCLSKNSTQIKEDLLKMLNFETNDWITPDFLAKVSEYMKPPMTVRDFRDEDVGQGLPEITNKDWAAQISKAVVCVMKFFHGLLEYNVWYHKVKPLQELAQSSKAASETAQAKKEAENKHLEKVSQKQRVLQEQLDSAKRDLAAVVEEQRLLEEKLATAEKFTSLLASSNTRWGIEIVKLKEFKVNIAGDCLLGSSFISYIGVFDSFFRAKIMEKWISIINSQEISITKDINLVNTLVSEDKVLKMKGEGLPSDPFSIENSVIITQCSRYPLIIDPQMQAITWLKNRPMKNTIVQYKQDRWDSMIGEAIGSGDVIIIEDVDQEIDPMLVPIMGKQTTNKDKGKAQIKVKSSDYPFNPNTRIYFLTKIANPHYKPEIVAQCTLINFVVTEKGLEDQLLALVVNKERPDLEETITEYITLINNFQAELIQSEDQVLENLKNADEATILDNKNLIESLEQTKTKSKEIEERKKDTEVLIKGISEKREMYRGVGEEGAMLYFLISKLFMIQNVYYYSLSSFEFFFKKAINKTPLNDNLQIRVKSLREKIRLVVYGWISSGMFEKDKQLLLTMIAIRWLQKKALKHESLTDITQKHIDFLLKCLTKSGISKDKNLLDYINKEQWEALCYLSDLEGLQGFAEKIEKEYSNKFRDWFNEIAPEEIDLPPEWKKYKKYDFHKILILRACRPERVGVALNAFIAECLPQGPEFLYARTFSDNLYDSYMDSTPDTPIFFILSPGSNPIKDLEVLGGERLPREIKKKFVKDHGFKYIAMGQNAEKGAEEELKNCNANGEWLFLQNIHLMPKWLKTLEDRIKEIAKEKGHEDFRLYLSAEPSDDIPVGILEKSIKLTNEPPSGLKENMKIAYSTLKSAEGVSQQDDPRRCAIIFGLCYYHAVVIERKKFGSLGWNRIYPFNLDDLRNSDAVVAKYLEKSTKIPWEDLRYIVGEIMYGGHIVDDMDRKLNNSYLYYILGDKLNEDLNMVPYPSNSNAMKVNPIITPINNAQYPFETWSKYIDVVITSESPALFGLHPNAELEYRITESETLFRNLVDLEPKDSGAGSESSEGNKFDEVKLDADRIISHFADHQFDISKLKSSDRELDPAQNVFLQEYEQMANLCDLIKKNCTDVKEAVDGKLTMNESIERLIGFISAKRVPPKWIADGFATTRALASWETSLKNRIEQLKQFAENDNGIPVVVFINRLFNPLSYLTAIRQIAARGGTQELDKLDIYTEPSSVYMNSKNDPVALKLNSGDVPIYGMHLQGCRFDEENRVLEESRPKEKFFVMPIIICRVLDSATLLANTSTSYVCPIYKTIERQSTFVCFAHFKTKVAAAKWTIAGVAVILDCAETDEIQTIRVQGMN